MLHLEVDQNGVAQAVRSDDEYEEVYRLQCGYLPEIHRAFLYINLEDNFQQFLIELDKLQCQFGYDNLLHLYLADKAKKPIYAISGTTTAIHLCRVAADKAGAKITSTLHKEITIDMDWEE